MSAADKEAVESTADEEQSILEERGARYGPFALNHENLGLIWTGMLQNYYKVRLPEPIPDHIALLMMAASKLNRASGEKGDVHHDNYVDLRNYAELARKAKEGEY